MKKRTTLVNVTSKYRWRLFKTCIPFGSKITNQEIGNNKSYLDFPRHKKYIIRDPNIPTQKNLLRHNFCNMFKMVLERHIMPWPKKSLVTETAGARQI